MLTVQFLNGYLMLSGYPNGIHGEGDKGCAVYAK
jgi:hypothetical protein